MRRYGARAHQIFLPSPCSHLEMELRHVITTHPGGCAYQTPSGAPRPASPRDLSARLPRCPRGGDPHVESAPHRARTRARTRTRARLNTAHRAARQAQGAAAHAAGRFWPRPREGAEGRCVRERPTLRRRVSGRGWPPRAVRWASARTLVRHVPGLGCRLLATDWHGVGSGALGAGCPRRNAFGGAKVWRGGGSPKGSSRKRGRGE